MANGDGGGALNRGQYVSSRGAAVATGVDGPTRPRQLVSDGNREQARTGFSGARCVGRPAGGGRGRTRPARAMNSPRRGNISVEGLQRPQVGMTPATPRGGISAEFELEEAPRTPSRLTGTSRHRSEPHGPPSLRPRTRPRYAHHTDDDTMGLRREHSNRHISLMRSLSPRRGGRSRPRSTFPSSPSSRPHQRRRLSLAWIPSAVAGDDGTSGRRSHAPDLHGTTVTQETTVNPVPMNTD